MKNKTPLSGLSLFSGAGGMDVGFIRAGVEIVSANDIDRDACLTYEANHPGGIIKCGDINQNLTDIRRFEGIDIVFGGPPCQGFSVAGKMNPDDPRSKLLWVFMKAVEFTKPRAFICENVKALAVLDKWSEVRQQLFRFARQLGYKYKLVVLNSTAFGVPQSRERMFLIGFRDIEDINDLEAQFERYKKQAPTVRDIVLPLGVAGSENNQRVCNAKVTIAAKPVMRRSPYAGMMFNGQGRPLNPTGYSCALHASMGGNKTPIIDEEHCYFGQDSWVEWYHSYLMAGGEPLSLDAAPKRLRRLTIDEALRIQTFPHDYQFIGGQSSIYRQIGNAVPCDLAQVVAEVVRDFLSTPELITPLPLMEREAKQLRLAI
ncbi:DNA (cytosine-5-)-methyltransferase [Phormidesmis priestleyi ULC007]|uniref:Cytosine-specific methyltransferase n=1 Tax=Phormidesmis priestleyi ULC007 TaxID=1920490 RepID=A0A2T1DBI3_9CYAN|nr:DNA (cytosine-5-)-methyltransferase [Phormidesmis priestleyi]PSB17817.1 DNA (cytosine-5-)-methyltransferase [Phormidesmis priestleyi ULC007]PZO46465.1 MAG: DNA (cytosine-5-)-methyltransferase [Phormidesmis priestleyi]